MSRRWSRCPGVVLACLLVVCGVVLPVHARSVLPQSVAKSTSTDPQAKFMFDFGPAAPWTAPIHWRYNAAGEPPQFPTSLSVAALQNAMAKWSGVCNVAFVYDGATAIPPRATVIDPIQGTVPDSINVIGWGAAAPFIPGAAGVTFPVPYLDDNGNITVGDADIILDNTGRIGSQDVLDQIALHEVGHMLGLGHSEILTSIMSGPPVAPYSGLSTLQTDDVRGCRCLYGPAPGQGAAYTCSLPKKVEFGDTPTGAQSAPQAFTIFNDGNVPLTVTGITSSGTELRLLGGCPAGIVLPPGARCTEQLAVVPARDGFRAEILTVATSDGNYPVPTTFNALTGTAPHVAAVEYYNPTLDHYFVTWLANEIAILDAGVKIRNWVRTGRSFRAFPVNQPGASPVCRFYIPPDKGNSHFYGRGTTECNATAQNNPTFVLEDPAFMFMILPDAGVCPAGTTPVYRVFSNRADANHRYMTDPALRDAMVSIGWLAEGDGPDRVVMCAP